MSKSRVFASAALAGVLVVAGLLAAPAFADDPPPLVWTTVEGFPTTTEDEQVSVAVQTATMAAADIGAETDFPLQRIEIINTSDRPRYFHFGIDIDTQGVIEPLWLPETFGGGSSWNAEMLGVRLEPGQSIVETDAIVYHGIAGVFEGVPVYPGRTVAIYELDADPLTEPDPVATEIARVPATPGEFVPVHFDAPETPEGTAPVGQELTIVGSEAPGEEVTLFPGVPATATAEGLPANREMELWLVPAFDYFFAVLLGGIIPDTALLAGTTTTTAEGVLDETIVVPADAEFDSNYRLLAGDAADRWWPAGTYRSFIITTPSVNGTDIAEPTDVNASIALDSTSVEFAFPAGTGGEWSAAVSTTGPVVNEFTLAGDPPLYYFLDTTASLNGTEVEVCITYNQSNIPGDPPRLYHNAAVSSGAYQWVDITSSRQPGKVCGLTSSFSPFALGYPNEFDFTGFFSPVSMTAENVAKPGQAIPVKFSLNGDQGLDVVTSAHFVIEGTDPTPEGQLIPATTAGGSGLSYSASSDQYTYVWKTAKTLSLKTGRFELTLSDGTVHTFNVTFKK